MLVKRAILPVIEGKYIKSVIVQLIMLTHAIRHLWNYVSDHYIIGIYLGIYIMSTVIPLILSI